MRKSVQNIEKDYSERLAIARRNAHIYGGVGQYIINDVAERAAQEMILELNKLINKGHAFFPFLLTGGFALFADFFDTAEIFGGMTLIYYMPIKFVMIFIDLFVLMTLYMFISFTGPKHKRFKLHIIFWILSFLEIFTPIGALPLWTVSVIWTWLSVRKEGVSAEKILQTLEKSP